MPSRRCRGEPHRRPFRCRRNLHCPHALLGALGQPCGRLRALSAPFGPLLLFGYALRHGAAPSFGGGRLK